MKLLNVPDYSIRTVIPSSSDVAPTSEIIAGGLPTGQIVDGAILEAALKWKEYVLLF